MLCIYTKQLPVPTSLQENNGVVQWNKKYGNKGGETQVSDSGILLYCYRVGSGRACRSKEGGYDIQNGVVSRTIRIRMRREKREGGDRYIHI